MRGLFFRQAVKLPPPGEALGIGGIGVFEALRPGAGVVSALGLLDFLQAGFGVGVAMRAGVVLRGELLIKKGAKLGNDGGLGG